MGKKASEDPRGKRKRLRLPEFSDQEEKILQDALRYLVFKHGHLLVPTNIRAEPGDGSQRWIIIVTLRYPTGFEGEIGDLLYDGQEFTFLTPLEVRRERAQKIERGGDCGMSIELPLYPQENRNTCALACLRMVLAAFGTQVEAWAKLAIWNQ